MLRLVLVAVLGVLCLLPGTESMHHGCNATAADPTVWECDFQIWPRLPYLMWWQNLSDFTTPIKKLRIYNIDLYISSQMFKNLSGYSSPDYSQNLSDYINQGGPAVGAPSITTTFDLAGIFLDQNSEPELVLECNDHHLGYLALYNDSFVGLEWMKRITIVNCHLAGFHTGAFRVFPILTSFRMLGGVFNDMSYNALHGVTLHQTDVLGSGLVEITSEFPFNFLFFFMIDPLKGATTLSIRGNNMNRVQTGLVQQFTNLSRLDMSYNEYYFLPETIFDGLDRLASVELQGIKWFCYCTGTWLFQWRDQRNAELEGEFICEFPSSFKGQRLYDYRRNECNTTQYYGLLIADTFVEATDWILLSGMFLILLFSLITIILSVQTIKFKKNPFNTTKGTGRRKPPKIETKGRKQGWKG